MEDIVYFILSLVAVGATALASYLIKKLQKPKKAKSLNILIINSNHEENYSMATLPVTGTAVAVLASGLDAKGGVVPLPVFDNPPAWSIDSNFATVTASPDSMSCSIVPVGAVGNAVLTVSGTVGGAVLSGSASIDFVAGPAVALAIEITVS